MVSIKSFFDFIYVRSRWTSTTPSLDLDFLRIYRTEFIDIFPSFNTRCITFRETMKFTFKQGYKYFITPIKRVKQGYNLFITPINPNRHSIKSLSGLSSPYLL